MPFNANFTSAMVGVDRQAGGATALFVEGDSTEPDQVSEMYVGLRHDGRLVTAPVEDPTGLDHWVTKFPEGEVPFEVGSDVALVGMAILPSAGEPFVWGQTLAVTRKAGDTAT